MFASIKDTMSNPMFKRQLTEVVITTAATVATVVAVQAAAYIIGNGVRKGISTIKEMRSEE